MSDRVVGLEERRHRTEQLLYLLWSNVWASNFFQASTTRWSLQAATSQRPIVFAPEGLPLDRITV